FAGLDLVADVDFRGGVASHQHYGKAGGAALGGQGGDARFQLSFDIVADAISVEDLSWQAGACPTNFGHSLTMIACGGRAPEALLEREPDQNLGLVLAAIEDARKVEVLLGPA